MEFATIKTLSVKVFGDYNLFLVAYIIFITSIPWPLKREYFGPSTSNSFIFYAWRTLIGVIYVIVAFDMVSDGIMVRHELPKLTYSLTTSTLFYATLFHYLTLILNKKEIEECLDLLNKNYHHSGVGNSEADMRIIKNGEETLKLFIKVYTVIVVLGVIARTAHHLSPPVQMLLPFPFSEHLVSPFFGILFFLQLFGLAHYLTAVVSSQMVILGFFIKTTNHLDILIKHINKLDIGDFSVGVRKVLISRDNPPEKIKTKVDKKMIREIMTVGIAYHQQIFSVVRRMSTAIAPTMFLQVFGSGLFLALLCADLIWKSEENVLKAVAQMTYGSIFFVNAAILCFYGSRLEVKSQQAANSWYEGPWLEMDVENQKIFMFFLKSLWHSPKVKAAGVWPVNLPLLVNFIYLIYDTITFLLRTMDRISL